MYVDIVRISGDIYVRGKKIIFAVDFKMGTDSTFEHVDWLIGWAKIGLMSCGHTVPESAACSISAFAELAEASVPTTEEFTGFPAKKPKKSIKKKSRRPKKARG